jgi:hypothetical protein
LSFVRKANLKRHAAAKVLPMAQKVNNNVAFNRAKIHGRLINFGEIARQDGLGLRVVKIYG